MFIFHSDVWGEVQCHILTDQFVCKLSSYSWQQLERVAQDRRRWREVVLAYAPGGAKGISK